MPEGDAVGLVHFAGDFGELSVGGDADGAGDVRADMGADAAFYGAGDLNGVCLFALIEAAGELIYGFDGFYGEDGGDFVDQRVVRAAVEVWALGNED